MNNCSHYRVTPVETEGIPELDLLPEVVAYLCLDCDTALPAEWEPPPPPLPSWNPITHQHEGLPEEVVAP